MASQLKRLSFASTVLVLALAGCTTSEGIDLPDGRKGYAISCGGAMLDWDSCLKKAREQCGEAGYDLLRKGERTRQKSTGSAIPHTIEGTSIPVTDRELVIACKTPPFR